MDSLGVAPYTLGPTVVHVVDNASRDGSEQLVREQYRWARYTRLDVNAGFSAGNNVALRAVRAPYVLLLNPDTEVLPGALDELVRALEARPEAAVCGPRLVDDLGVPDHNAHRTFPSPRDALQHFLGLGRSSYRTPAVREDGQHEVDAVSGAAMLVRRAAMDQVGRLDEGYWMYGEDLDWCRRFAARGWTVLYHGSATILHVKGGASGGRRSLRQVLAFHQAMGRFYRKFDAGRSSWLDGLVYTGIAARAAVIAARTLLAARTRPSARRAPPA